MLKLTFTIDEDFLLKHTLDCMDSYRQKSRNLNKYKDFITLHDEAKKMNGRGYELFVRECIPEIQNIPLKDVVKILREARDLPEKLKNTNEYRRILSQTKEHLEEVKGEWESNYDVSLAHMQDITGLNFEGQEFTVNIVHWLIPSGHYRGNKRIAWGNRKIFYDGSGNYSTVYLYHEMLHDPDFLGRWWDDISHSIIELATDEELRVRLNGGEYPRCVGHENLWWIKKEILDDWRRYLAFEDRNIFQFYEIMIDKFKKMREEFRVPEPDKTLE